MTKTCMALILCIAVLGLAVPGAQAQAPAGPGGMEQGGMMDMMGMMQQMGGMMKQMSGMMAGGQMGPDQMKPLGEMMGQMAEMMGGMSSMMGGGMMGGGGRGWNDAPRDDETHGGHDGANGRDAEAHGRHDGSQVMPAGLGRD